MPKFRKKPIVITADRFFPGERPWPEGVVTTRGGAWAIETLEGSMEVKPGDWIIIGVEGERYPCKPTIFAATYEAVKEADGTDS